MTKKNDRERRKFCVYPIHQPTGALCHTQQVQHTAYGLSTVWQEGQTQDLDNHRRRNLMDPLLIMTALTVHGGRRRVKLSAGVPQSIAL
jgi:hypothetical protein